MMQTFCSLDKYCEGIILEKEACDNKNSSFTKKQLEQQQQQ